MTFRELLLEVWEIDNAELEEMRRTCSDDLSWNLQMRRLWHEPPYFPRDTPELVAMFYAQNPLYSAHLLHRLPLDVEIDPHALNTDAWVQEVLEEYGTGKHLLDYGSGFGNTGCWSFCRGDWVDMADISSPHARFVAGLVEYIGDPKLQFFQVEEGSHLWRPYDVIVCSQVLEHVFYPMQVLRQFWESLLPGGLLLLDVFFDDCHDRAPYHLRRNNPFGDVDYWRRCVGSVGFQQVRSRVWCKGE